MPEVPTASLPELLLWPCLLLINLCFQFSHWKSPPEAGICLLQSTSWGHKIYKRNMIPGKVLGFPPSKLGGMLRKKMWFRAGLVYIGSRTKRKHSEVVEWAGPIQITGGENNFWTFCHIINFLQIKITQMDEGNYTVLVLLLAYCVVLPFAGSF